MKKGSALLVVLGMIAFMVISAVAFSAYMRYSRLPSSYLLRTSSSRHLVKAALAEAIDIIDVSIGNNPHPGVGDKKYLYPRNSMDSRNRNYWRSNCFIGTNQLVNAEDTVSTLTMEGLAYIPPALINEARYYSRHSSAAIWKTLGFDSGRYAFSAIDVSDHFDINRLRASVARDSSDRGRISLAHIFEKEDHTGFVTATAPKEWDTFVAKYYDPQKPYDTSKVPFTSLADLNLAINYSKPPKVVSPFCRYLESADGSDFVTSISGEDSAMMRSMAFVTDSYFPRSSSGGSGDNEEDAFSYLSLCDEENQPFSADDLRSSVNSIRTPWDYSSKGADLLRESIGRIGMLTLWDYLDEDSMPLSLALPTVERTPMVCAMQMKNLDSAKLELGKPEVEDVSEEKLDAVADNVGKTRTYKEKHHYKINVKSLTEAFQMGELNLLVAFPFLRDKDANGDFTVSAKVSLFLGDPELSLRPGADSALHLVKDEVRNNSNQAAVNDGVISVVLAGQQCSFSEVKDAESALTEFTFKLQPGTSVNLNEEIITVTYQWQQTCEKVGEDQYEWRPAKKDDAKDVKIVDATCSLPPVDKNGKPDVLAFLDEIKSGKGRTVSFHACAWVWVKNSDGKIVDLVPACIKDDDNLNDFANFSQKVGGVNLRPVAGEPFPLMKFSGASFEYSVAGLEKLAADGTAVDSEIASASVMVADPRYNYAPEHWFVMPQFGKTVWISNCECEDDGRDGDIFMATSDMGYLQSVYELAFLPRLTDLKGSGDPYYGDMIPVQSGTLKQFHDGFALVPNRHLAWCTYRPFKKGGLARDDFEGVGFNSEGNGFRVNPYSSSTPIIMAALANSPYNWMVAATNETAPNALSKSDREVGNFVRKYCFNQMGSADSRFDWQDLELIANNIKSAVHGRVDGDWQTGFDDLDWAGKNSDLAGVEFKGQTVDLYDVDRKFLYGYWRDSFAVKQQLFLVFVRAEPLMMGGGAIGQTPPQLGARAVALVWRDPTINDKDPNAPHRTRVLFYRQFD